MLVDLDQFDARTLFHLAGAKALREDREAYESVGRRARGEAVSRSWLDRAWDRIWEALFSTDVDDAAFSAVIDGYEDLADRALLAGVVNDHHLEVAV